jgi:Acyltransferase family
MTITTAVPPLERAAAAPPVLHPALGNLRAFVTLLVLLHHALLAYHPYAPPAGPSLTMMPFWRAFPVVDPARWSGATWIVGVNDTFFMALMFLLAGLFAWPSLARKGAATYARDRFLRIGLPLVVALLLLSPLAYIPSYLQTGAAWSWSGFWAQWSALDSWPSGPAWFLSLLLVFDALTLLAFAALRSVASAPAAPPPTARGRFAKLLRSPLVLFAVLATLAALAYLPMAMRFGTMQWTSWGPLTFQTSRVLLYAVFFFFGVGLGAAGLARTAFTADSALARRFYLWIAVGGLAFYASLKATLHVFATGGADPSAHRLAALAYAAGAVGLSFAALALFLRFTSPAPRPDTLDVAPGGSPLAASLRRNAYGMFLLHYPIVSWLQLSLTEVSTSGLVKASTVFTGTVAASWLLTIALRRIRPLDRVL